MVFLFPRQREQSPDRRQKQNKKRDRLLNIKEFNASELCSRKLWQLVNERESGTVAEAQLQQAVKELTTRRHYLAELARIGKLGSPTHNA